MSRFSCLGLLAKWHVSAQNAPTNSSRDTAPAAAGQQHTQQNISRTAATMSSILGSGSLHMQGRFAKVCVQCSCTSSMQGRFAKMRN